MIPGNAAEAILLKDRIHDIFLTVYLALYVFIIFENIYTHVMQL